MICKIIKTVVTCVKVNGIEMSLWFNGTLIYIRKIKQLQYKYCFWNCNPLQNQTRKTKTCNRYRDSDIYLSKSGNPFTCGYPHMKIWLINFQKIITYSSGKMRIEALSQSTRLGIGLRNSSQRFLTIYICTPILYMYVSY